MKCTIKHVYTYIMNIYTPCIHTHIRIYRIYTDTHTMYTVYSCILV